MVNPYSAPSGTVAAPGTYSYGSNIAAASPGSIEALRLTRPWVLFLAILGFIGAGFMVLAGLVMMMAGAMAGALAGSKEFPAWLGLLYFVLAPLYVAPSVKLIKYSSAISKLVASGGVSDLEEALNQQKGFWKLVGIMVIAVIALYVLILVGVVIFAISKVSH